MTDDYVFTEHISHTNLPFIINKQTQSTFLARSVEICSLLIKYLLIDWWLIDWSGPLVPEVDSFSLRRKLWANKSAWAVPSCPGWLTGRTRTWTRGSWTTTARGRYTWRTPLRNWENFSTKGKRIKKILIISGKLFFYSNFPLLLRRDS